MEGAGVVQRTSDEILVAIGIMTQRLGRSLHFPNAWNMFTVFGFLVAKSFTRWLSECILRF